MERKIAGRGGGGEVCFVGGERGMGVYLSLRVRRQNTFVIITTLVV